MTSTEKALGEFIDAWKAGVFEKQFGERHVRVLTITTTPARVATMKAAVRKLTNGNGSGLFLFIDRATLAAADPLVAEWTSGKSERARLVDGK